jgi:hypothetical protein
MSNTVDRLAGASSSLAFKAPCRLATTANITLSGFQTIDGVLPTSAEHVDLRRILVKNQTDAAENGIYLMDTGPWERTKDFDGAGDFRQGTRVFVWGGSTQSGGYVVTSSMDPSTFDVGVNDIDFTAQASVDITNWEFADGTGLYDDDGNEQLIFQKTASAVGYFEMTNAAAGTPPQLSVASSESDVDMKLAPKGTGIILSTNALIVGSTASVPFAADSTSHARIQSHGTDPTAGFATGRFSNDSSPSRLSLLKSRNATVGSHTVVQDGDTIGEIRAAASDGTAFAQAALIAFKVAGTPGSSDMPGRVLVQTSSDGSATPQDRLNVDSTGATVSGSAYISGAAYVSSAISAASPVSAPAIKLGGTTGSEIAMYGATAVVAHTSATTGTDIVAAGITTISSAVTTWRLDPPSVGLIKHIVRLSSDTATTGTINLESGAILSSANSTGTVIALTGNSGISLMGLSTALWSVVARFPSTSLVVIT